MIKLARVPRDTAVQPHQAPGQSFPQPRNTSENHLISWEGLNCQCALAVRKREGPIIKGRAWPGQRGRHSKARETTSYVASSPAFLGSGQGRLPRSLETTDLGV